jgi:iron complex transport system substrate-binding protein
VREEDSQEWLSYKTVSATENENQFRGKLRLMKICSLLPSATEILFALGLGDQVAGVSHECDFPPEARSKPVLIKSRITHTESAAAIDRQVREFLARGESLYSVDFEILSEIEPDMIVTQDLCHVCAATPDDLGAALAHLKQLPRVLTLNPHSLADVCADIRTVGEATSCTEQANAVVAEFERGIAHVERSVAGFERPRVLCLEWLDPPYVAGHWVPEMVERAGGIDVLGHQGKPSIRVEWDAVLAAQPEVIVVMPCGYSLVAAHKEFRDMPLPPGWNDLPAVRDGCVFVVEASGYFSRPGPRLAAGLGILAEAIHAGKQSRRLPFESESLLARVAAAG